MVVRDWDMKTSNAQPSSSILTPNGLRFDPLRQHLVNPVLPVVLSRPADTTRTVFLGHPFERLSPTLASSPRIVEASPTRHGSVHPSMSEHDTMDRRLIPGADFFDDGSSSSSDFGNAAGTPTQMHTSGSGPRDLDRPYVMDNDDRSAPRGRSRQQSTATAFFHGTSLPVHSSDYSGTIEEPAANVVTEAKITSHARRISLTRLNKDNVQLVDNRSIRSSIDSPRHSILGGYNNASFPGSPAYPASALAAMFPPSATPHSPGCKNGEDKLTSLPHDPTSWKGHHRRSASDRNSSADSVFADSIINAHVHTMRALEALGGESRGSGNSEHTGKEREKEKGEERAAAGRSYLNSGTTTSWPKSTASFSETRRVALEPLSTTTGWGSRDAPPRREGDADNEHAAAVHVSPFITTPTPNPFATPLHATTPEFPVPRHEKRHGTLPNFSLSNSDHSTDGEYARLDSANTSIFPDEAASYHLPDKPETAYDARKGKHVLGLLTRSSESLDLRSRRERNESAQGLIRSHAESNRGWRRDVKSREVERLVIWVGVRRWTWGMGSDGERGRGRGRDECGRGRLGHIFIPSKLADSDVEQEKQLDRYQYPKNSNAIDTDADFDDTAFAGKLRAANHQLIGHWFCFSARTLRGIRFGRRGICTTIDSSDRRGSAEKLATSTSPLPPPHPSETHLLSLYNNPIRGSKKYMVVTWARRIAAPASSSSSSSSTKDTHGPTLELVYTLSPTRVLVVMIVLLGISVAAALCWIFLGHGPDTTKDSNAGPSQRVEGGMAMGVLTLLVEACGFGAWVAFS